MTPQKPGVWRAAPRERRALTFDFAANAREGEFEGYASLFNLRDQGGDVVMPGAFRRTLRARGVGGVKLLYQHDTSEPIGVWSDIHEDKTGLYVRGRIVGGASRGRDVLALTRADEAEMYAGLHFAAVPGSGQATVYWSAPRGGILRGNIKLNYIIG